MTETARSQTLDNPQQPLESSITISFRRRIGVLVTLVALGVSSSGCGTKTQTPAKDTTTLDIQAELTALAIQAEIAELVARTKAKKAAKDPTTNENKQEEQGQSVSTTPQPEPVEEPPASDEDEDMRTMWERIKDKVKAEAFRKGVEEKCEEKAGRFSKVCSATVMLATDKACIKIDEFKLKPTIKAVCEHKDIGKFCTGKNEQILGAFLAYCAEKRQEPKAF